MDAKIDCNNGEARAFSITDVAGYNSTRCLSLHIAAAAQHRFTSFFSEISNQATLKSPGFEHENLDRPKPGMLIPNYFKHVLRLCADTSSRLGSFFCTPNQ